jgi:hypothetical protein
LARRVHVELIVVIDGKIRVVCILGGKFCEARLHAQPAQRRGREQDFVAYGLMIKNEGSTAIGPAVDLA